VDANHNNDVPQTTKHLPSTQRTVSSNRTDHSAKVPSTSVLLTPTVEPFSIPALRIINEASVVEAAPSQSHLSAEIRVKLPPPPLNLDSEKLQEGTDSRFRRCPPYHDILGRPSTPSIELTFHTTVPESIYQLEGKKAIVLLI